MRSLDDDAFADGLMTFLMPFIDGFEAFEVADELATVGPRLRARNLSRFSKFSGFDQHSLAGCGPTHTVSLHFAPSDVFL